MRKNWNVKYLPWETLSCFRKRCVHIQKRETLYKDMTWKVQHENDVRRELLQEGWKWSEVSKKFCRKQWKTTERCISLQQLFQLHFRSHCDPSCFISSLGHKYIQVRRRKTRDTQRLRETWQKRILETVSGERCLWKTLSTEREKIPVIKEGLKGLVRIKRQGLKTTKRREKQDTAWKTVREEDKTVIKFSFNEKKTKVRHKLYRRWQKEKQRYDHFFGAGFNFSVLSVHFVSLHVFLSFSYPFQGKEDIVKLRAEV